MAINDDLVDARVRLYAVEQKVKELEAMLLELLATPAKAMVYQPDTTPLNQRATASDWEQKYYMGQPDEGAGK